MGNSYSQGDQGSVDPRRRAVIGLETASGDTPTQSVQALYVGRVQVEFFVKVGDGTEVDRKHFGADITLKVDFSKNTVGGVIDNWENRDGDGEYVAGVSHTAANAAVSGNGLTTSMAPSSSCAGCVDVVDSTITRKFYGRFADDTGGKIQGEFRDGGKDLVGVGISCTWRV